MSFLEKLGFGKHRELTVDDEIARAESDIAKKSAELESFKKSFPLSNPNNKELELLGLRNRLAFLQEKKRHEDQKTAENLDEFKK